ncbi:MAG: tRNA pseudouridine(55) synthase TruB [Pseudomonadota bacterium]
MAGKRKRGRDVNGILLLDKEQGPTSNGCLQQAKRMFAASKAGHTGSLDPLATGVLPLCFGEATKISQFLLDADKRYQVTAQLGQRTDTADREGDVIAEGDVPALDRDRIEALLVGFRGVQEQLPPMYSAVKQNGVPLYKLARAGEEVERKRRRITIHELTLLEIDGDRLILDVACTKGTYVRTLVDDIGQVLGCGAHVAELRRTMAGAFRVEDCVTMERLGALKEEGGFEAIDACLVPVDAAVSTLPEVVLPEATARFLKQGQPVIVRHLPTDGLVRLYEEEQFIGIGAILDDGRVAPRRMISGS